jgi:hypothetical protein
VEAAPGFTQSVSVFPVHVLWLCDYFHGINREVLHDKQRTQRTSWKSYNYFSIMNFGRFSNKDNCYAE